MELQKYHSEYNGTIDVYVRPTFYFMMFHPSGGVIENTMSLDRMVRNGIRHILDRGVMVRTTYPHDRYFDTSLSTHCKRQFRLLCSWISQYVYYR